MSRRAVDKVLEMHVKGEKARGVTMPNVEKLRERIVKIARESDSRNGKRSDREK